jgi:DHA3 family macrolide efflux protein-like MFS transporter
MEQTMQRSSKWQIPFFTIWTGQALSLIGSKVAQFALVWWLTQLTGSATVLATATMATMIPQIVLGPIAGAYVDRWNRRVIMILADGFIALASLWLAYLFWSGAMQVWHVYAIMLVRALGDIFHWPAMEASTSLMVPEKHLSRVAGLNHTLQGGLNIVGPPLGAMLLAVLPLHGIMLTDVGTATLAILPLFFVHIPQPQRSSTGPRDSQGTKPSIWSDVREGLRYVWEWPGVLAVMGMAMILNFVLTPVGSLVPLLVTQHFNGQALQLGWLESGWGIGVLLGGLLLSVWGGFRRRIYTSLVGLVLTGMGFAAMGLAPTTAFWLAVGGFFVTGLANPLVNGPMSAVLQATVAPEMQGRVFTVLGSLTNAITPLSLAVAGPVVDVVGIRSWYIVGGVLCTAMGVGAFFVPVVVNLEQNHTVEDATSLSTKAAVEMD